MERLNILLLREAAAAVLITLAVVGQEVTDHRFRASDQAAILTLNLPCRSRSGRTLLL
jgi:hypothetical protein